MSVDDRLRSACEDRCEGDPPCYELDEDAGVAFNPCEDCLRECGLEPTPPPPDPEAVIRPLL